MIGIGLSIPTLGVTGGIKRENLLLQSQTFGATWNKSPVGIGITSDTTVAPDGTTTADTITDTVDGANTQHFVSQTNVGGSPANGASIVLSVYAKSGTNSVIGICPNGAATGYTFDLAGGTVGAQVNSAPLDKGIISVGSGWYRCWVKYAYNLGSPEVRIYMATSTASVLYTGAGTGTVILWGAQANLDVLQPYTATTSTIVQ